MWRGSFVEECWSWEKAILDLLYLEEENIHASAIKFRKLEMKIAINNSCVDDFDDTFDFLPRVEHIPQTCDLSADLWWMNLIEVDVFF